MAKKTLLVPGDELRKLLEEYNIPISTLAADIGLSVSAVRQIAASRAKISLHIARRLAKYFTKTSVEYWVNLQNAFDIAEMDKDPQFAEAFKKIPKAKKLAPPPVKAKKSADNAPKSTAPKRTRKIASSSDDAPAKPKAPRKPRAKKADPENTDE